jgi:hypothetical protein
MDIACFSNDSAWAATLINTYNNHSDFHNLTLLFPRRKKAQGAIRPEINDSRFSFAGSFAKMPPAWCHQTATNTETLDGTRF